jgi:hypothetical protein
MMRKILPLITAALLVNCWTGAATAQVGTELSPTAVQLLDVKSHTLPAGVAMSESRKIAPKVEIDSSRGQTPSLAARMLTEKDLTHLKIEAEQSRTPSLKSKAELQR